MRAALLLATGPLLLSGCITEEIIPPAVVRKDVDGKPTWVRTRRIKGVNEDPQKRSEPELRAAVAERPKDPRAWYRLGEFYERERRFREALTAYQALEPLIGKEAKKQGRSYVGGLYLIGKMHAVLGEWPESIEALRKVLREKPSEIGLALQTPTFREAHYLLGAIYFRFQEWNLAEDHLRSCEALGGVDHRVRAMMSRCEAELRPVSLQAKARGGKR